MNEIELNELQYAEKNSISDDMSFLLCWIFYFYFLYYIIFEYGKYLIINT